MIVLSTRTPRTERSCVGTIQRAIFILGTNPLTVAVFADVVVGACAFVIVVSLDALGRVDARRRGFVRRTPRRV